MHAREKLEDPYERKLPYARFSKIIHEYEPNSKQPSTAEEVDLGEYGKQLWGLGYLSSEWEEDADRDSDYSGDEKE